MDLVRRVVTAPKKSKDSDASEETNARVYAGGSNPSDNENQKYDGYIDRLRKYIPAEIIATWILVKAALPSDINVFALSVFFLFLVLTPIYIWKMTTIKGGDAIAWPQIIIGTLAFPIWGVAIGDPILAWILQLFPSYEQTYTIAIVGLFSLVSGLVPQGKV